MRPKPDSIDSLLRDAVDISEPASLGLPRRGLSAGSLLAERFVIEHVASCGGMGVIHRALDLQTRQAAAIKVMASRREVDARRFSQEALVLADLAHPAIVRYLAQGTTPWGTPFIAMEWLEGEDLAKRLARAPLRLDESLWLVRRACEGVAAAHARGVVHRDLKPSNLFLVDGDPAALKVLDFGIARRPLGEHAITHPGVVLGTVGYMAPEQAMGARDVDARADVFALGCILFECLTGRAPFTGPNKVAVLAKVVGQEAPRVSELRPDLGPTFDRLVARTLSKQPDQRPRDAAALLRELERLGPGLSAPVRAASWRSPSVLTTAEQRIVSVILGKPRPAEPQACDDTLDDEQPSIQELSRRFGAQPFAMLGGGLLVVLSGRGPATDQARQAASCALALARGRPKLGFVVATGLAQTARPMPTGAAIDRAAQMLDRLQHTRRAVVIDELTAGLLDARFEIIREHDQLLLTGERAQPESPSTLLGKPSRFVGRDKELGLLVMTLRQCIDESVARAVLVTGPPGQGKTRLQHELVARLRTAGDARVLIARADAAAAGSAFLFVRQLVRGAVALREGSERDQAAQLRAHVASICQPADAARVTEFLGVLLGIAAENHPSPELRAARNDPQIMNVWLRRSIGEWLAAECAKQPLVLVLDDLHWGDQPSIGYIDDALRALSARPLMVLALARPEVHDTFSDLWPKTETQRIALGRLTPRAAEHLVRGALGDALGPREVSRIVAHADGNAFYLEELIRRVADGDSTTLPETVLALAQTRLERLEPDQRRVIRAASIFGEVFWRGGLEALLGAEPGARELEACLQTLVDAELLTPSHESCFSGERQYAFRHDLLREAAYAMLTETDRLRGHGVAGDWLERAGARHALTLADHFARSEDPVRASAWFVRAAQASYDGGNITDALTSVERGVAGGARGEERGKLVLIQAQALALIGDWPTAACRSQEAMSLLPRGSTAWFLALGGMLCSASNLGNARSIAALQEYMDVPVQPEPSGPYGFATHAFVLGCATTGQTAAAQRWMERVEALDVGRSEDVDPAFGAWLRNARAILCLCTHDLGGALRALREARLSAERTGAEFARVIAASNSVWALSEIGHAARLADAADTLYALCARTGMVWLSDWTTWWVASARIATDAAAEAVAPLQALLDRRDKTMVISAHASLALALLACGDPDAAERHAMLSMDGAELPMSRATALRSRAVVQLGLGRPERALTCADEGLEAARQGCGPQLASALRVARSEALHALGRTDEARGAIRDTHEHIRRVARTLDDPELRAAFMAVPVHARALHLAEQWSA